jgi:hypothetical protein
MTTYLRTYVVLDVSIFEDSPTGFKLAYDFLSAQCNKQRGTDLQLKDVGYRKDPYLGICRHYLSEPCYGKTSMPEKDIVFRVSGKYLVEKCDSHPDAPHLCETCALHFKPVLLGASADCNMMLPWPSVDELIKELYPEHTSELKRKEIDCSSKDTEDAESNNKKQKV